MKKSIDQKKLQQFNQTAQLIIAEQQKLNSAFSKSVDLLLVESFKKLIKIL